MYRLITISCYFGKLPEYFPIFLRSLEANPTVDFLLVTDCKISHVPDNVRVHRCTFQQMKERLQKLFDFPIVLDRPYKLCDYKPLWMMAFAEYLPGYDFCGYCDMDLIFGDIRSFLTDDILSKYDKFYEMGHLTYYRNTEEVLQRYRLDGGVDYRHAFTTADIVAFDEVAGMQNIYDHHGFATYKARDCADITYRRVRFTRTDFRVPPEELPTNNYQHQLFYWEDGKVFRAYPKDDQVYKDEFIYIHMSKRKLPCNDVDGSCRSFFITSSGFRAKATEITKADILRFEPFRPLSEFGRFVQCKWSDTKENVKYYWEILKRKLVP